MKTRWRFRTRTGTRFPTLKERYTTSKPAYNQIAIVNPQLKPERARGVDLTWNGAFTHDWGFEVSVYYNRVSDAILSHNIDADTIQNRTAARWITAVWMPVLRGKSAIYWM